MEGSASSQPAREESADQSSLELQLGKQFEEAISNHPSLNIDQAFYVEASRLHRQLLKYQEEVVQLGFRWRI